MHEMALTRRILAAALEEAAREGIARIGALEVGISPFSGIDAEEVGLCFELASRGTPAERAALTVREMALQGRCRACGADVTISNPRATCACGSADLELAPLQDWRLVAVEVAHSGDPESRPRSG